MIKINIETKHVADINDDEELKGSTCELNIWGEPDEIKHELITLLEAIEKRPALALIWHEALSEHISAMNRNDK